MDPRDEEKIGEVLSTIAVVLMVAVACLIALSAAVWVHDTFF